MKSASYDMLEKARVNNAPNRECIGTLFGSFVIRNPIEPGSALVVVSAPADADIWRRTYGTPEGGVIFDHVSVSILNGNRCPTWEEMSYVKGLFWNDEETVIQFHPKRSAYVNCHPFTLHLWKPVGLDIPLPPRECI